MSSLEGKPQAQAYEMGGPAAARLGGSGTVVAAQPHVLPAVDRVVGGTIPWDTTAS